LGRDIAAKSVHRITVLILVREGCGAGNLHLRVFTRFVRRLLSHLPLLAARLCSVGRYYIFRFGSMSFTQFLDKLSPLRVRPPTVYLALAELFKSRHLLGEAELGL